MLLACHTTEEQPQLKWYLDTDCSNHMCGRKDLFERLDESVRSTVKFGNNSTIPVMEKGRIGIILKNGSKAYIMDLYYVPGLPFREVPESRCENCIFGKKHRDPFSVNKARKADQHLEIVHSDLCGPIESDAFQAFRSFKAYAERQIGKSIKILRTDRVDTAVYLLNRCPTNCLNNITPEEAWRGVRPSVRHLKIFGCIAYAHVPKELRKELDDKSEKCILVGYSSVTKGYRLYNPEAGKLFTSRDVIFNEDSKWNWNNGSTTNVDPYNNGSTRDVDSRNIGSTRNVDPPAAVRTIPVEV
ncbi:uncharacterized protein LOC113352154 [Papaver somniferum]|uniref:uncharacterized protein LOC113352154 n=1 Tax=Papaver somniferum TaxID=3469 RepID=UPI000E7004C9|nr:uncharacterized protein LOC113352154 [Papaver somniferum]